VAGAVAAGDGASRTSNRTGGPMAAKKGRDLETSYSNAGFVAKLRRLADAIEHERRFAIQIAGERIVVPPDATFSIEHERSGDGEEIEFQIKWKVR
jgi:amphi-Trp domain-containing protein